MSEETNDSIPSEKPSELSIPMTMIQNEMDPTMDSTIDPSIDPTIDPAMGPTMGPNSSLAIQSSNEIKEKETPSTQDLHSLTALCDSFPTTHLQPVSDKRAEAIYEDHYLNSPYTMADGSIESNDLGTLHVTIHKELEDYRKGMNEVHELQEKYMKSSTTTQAPQSTPSTTRIRLNYSQPTSMTPYLPLSSLTSSVDQLQQPLEQGVSTLSLDEHVQRSIQILGTLFHYLYSKDSYLEGKTFRKVNGNDTISIDEIKRKCEKFHINYCFISNKNIKSFYKCLNSTYIVNYLKVHQDKYVQYSFKEMLQVLKKLFPNHSYRIRYYSLINFYTSIDLSYSYFPSIIHQLNHLGHHAYYMIHQRHDTISQKYLNDKQYNGEEVFVSKLVFHNLDSTNQDKYIVENAMNTFFCSTCFISDMIELFLHSPPVIALNSTYMENGSMKLVVAVGMSLFTYSIQ